MTDFGYFSVRIESYRVMMRLLFIFPTLLWSTSTPKAGGRGVVRLSNHTLSKLRAMRDKRRVTAVEAALNAEIIIFNSPTVIIGKT